MKFLFFKYYSTYYVTFMCVPISLQFKRRGIKCAIRGPMTAIQLRIGLHKQILGNGLSGPLLLCLCGVYWFCLSRNVYDGNRSFAPVLRQSWWSLLYDVYWLVWWCWTGNGIKIPEHGSGSELHFSLFKQWTLNKAKESMRNEIEQQNE